MLHAKPGAFQIDVDDSIPVRLGIVRYRNEGRTFDAGTVDQHIQTSPQRQRPLN